MSYLMKALPIKRPKDIIKSECSVKAIHYLCPHCNRVYKSELSTTIFYDSYIDRSEEGVVVRTEYFCKHCGDYAFEIDKEIIPAVSMLRALGINTISSCSGHAEKFDQTSFQFEGGALAINDKKDTDYITYGPCISMLPPAGDKEFFAFLYTFDTFSADSYSMHNVMLCEPNKNTSKYFFFIAPVYDVKEFRRAGIQRRETMLKCANKHMHTFVSKFCTEYRKNLKKAKEANKK